MEREKKQKAVFEQALGVCMRNANAVRKEYMKCSRQALNDFKYVHSLVGKFPKRFEYVGGIENTLEKTNCIRFVFKDKQHSCTVIVTAYPCCSVDDSPGYKYTSGECLRLMVAKKGFIRELPFPADDFIDRYDRMLKVYKI